MASQLALKESLKSRALLSVIMRMVPHQTSPTILLATPDLDRSNPTMSSNNEEPGFRVVDNLIKDHLIEDAAKEAQTATVLKTEGETYSKLEWGHACTRLLDFYKREIHSQVCFTVSLDSPFTQTTTVSLPSSNQYPHSQRQNLRPRPHQILLHPLLKLNTKSAAGRAIPSIHNTEPLIINQISAQPEIIDIVKSPPETEATFSLVMRIEPQKSEQQLLRFIDLPGDYHIIIPLIPQGLPKWVEVRSTKKRTAIPWEKGSVIYCKGETDLVCSAEGQGICIFLGGRFKKE